MAGFELLSMKSIRSSSLTKNSHALKVQNRPHILIYMKAIRFFIYSSGILLLVTAMAKIVSSLGDASILQTPEPVSGYTFRRIFQVVGAVEFVLGIICLMSRHIWLQISLVAWLASSFVIYRLGLIWIGYHRPCNCLGNLTDALQISPVAADHIVKLILLYLLVGSYVALWSLWRMPKPFCEHSPVSLSQLPKK